ncbi:MAG: hypothetical protein Q4F67_08150 [Propionibacteriaceae bacterium]|nr:hypothetical protein [Propionibacteriaceae bacterium]
MSVGVRRIARLVGVPFAAVALLAGCAGSPPDPADEKVRDRAGHAVVGLDARLAPLLRQHEVLADWSADYCLNDPLTTFDWQCTATRNVALEVEDLHAGAVAVDTELTRLGCHPTGDPSVMGLATMIDNHPDRQHPADLPMVHFNCGQDDVFVQPSDEADPAWTGSLERPGAWPEQSTGEDGNRLMGGGAMTPDEATALREAAGPLLLVTATRGYHSE